MDLVPIARQRGIVALTLLLYVLLVALLFAGPSPRKATGAGGEAAVAEDPAAGRTIYSRQCAGCHGANLEGGTGGTQAALGANSVAAQQPDDWLFRVVKYGGRAVDPDVAGQMPAMGASLSDTEIRAVIAYLREQWSRAPSQ
jgi:mono/diheme cytochrome c family protein